MNDGNVIEKLEQSRSLPSNKQVSPEVRFDGQTVIITGAGGGLGRSYALMFARLGANVVVNDVSEKGAQAVVDEIVKGEATQPSDCLSSGTEASIAGGSAVPAVCSAEDGDKIVKVALDRFGAVHALIANAGILRDKSFTGMSEKEWDQVIAVHLRYDLLSPVEPSAEAFAQGHL
jgi:multifunctional beta-oxidation protein